MEGTYRKGKTNAQGNMHFNMCGYEMPVQGMFLDYLFFAVLTSQRYLQELDIPNWKSILYILYQRLVNDEKLEKSKVTPRTSSQ